MNAILRDDCEAIVLTNEAIEVHLSYLRPAVEALGEKLEELDKKFDHKLSELDRRFDYRLTELDSKFDHRLTELDNKFDQRLTNLDMKLDSGVSEVDSKLDELNKKIELRDKEHIERFSRIQASLDGLKWFVSSTAVLASGASIAHSLGWI